MMQRLEASRVCKKKKTTNIIVNKEEQAKRKKQPKPQNHIKPNRNRIEEQIEREARKYSNMSSMRTPHKQILSTILTHQIIQKKPHNMRFHKQIVRTISTHQTNKQMVNTTLNHQTNK